MKSILLATVLSVLCCGCLHSYVNVATEPADARVFFDFEDQGRTPQKIEFLWYGKHKIQIFKEGYERVDDVVDVRCPPHLYIPFDLFFTILPFNFEDNHNFNYALKPVEPVKPAE